MIGSNFIRYCARSGSILWWRATYYVRAHACHKL